MKKSPLAEVKERFGSKENLIKELKALFDKGDVFEDRLNPDKGLGRVSNAKLLHLFKIAADAKERFSSRAKLIEDLLKTLKREKDEGMKSRLSKWGLPRLLDFYHSATKRSK